MPLCLAVVACWLQLCQCQDMLGAVVPFRGYRICPFLVQSPGLCSEWKHYVQTNTGVLWGCVHMGLPTTSLRVFKDPASCSEGRSPMLFRTAHPHRAQREREGEGDTHIHTSNCGAGWRIGFRYVLATSTWQADCAVACDYFTVVLHGRKYDKMLLHSGFRLLSS